MAKRNKFEIGAGYSEWNLFMNDEFIYSFVDIGELIYSNGNDKPDCTLKDCIDISYETMVEEAEEKERDLRIGHANPNSREMDYNAILDFTKQDEKQVKQAMKKAFSCYY